jgi:hypothetical protein
MTDLSHESALLIKEAALNAITKLSEMVKIAKNEFNEDNYIRFRRNIGGAIGEIEQILMRDIYDKFPELDDIP